MGTIANKDESRPSRFRKTQCHAGFSGRPNLRNPVKKGIFPASPGGSGRKQNERVEG